jgi:hypothetical protein
LLPVGLPGQAAFLGRGGPKALAVKLSSGDAQFEKDTFEQIHDLYTSNMLLVENVYPPGDKDGAMVIKAINVCYEPASREMGIADMIAWFYRKGVPPLKRKDLWEASKSTGYPFSYFKIMILDRVEYLLGETQPPAKERPKMRVDPAPNSLTGQSGSRPSP